MKMDILIFPQNDIDFIIFIKFFILGSNLIKIEVNCCLIFLSIHLIKFVKIGGYAKEMM
jgi:hypothetical protein